LKTIVVASLNPVKADAVLGAFQRLFPDEEFSVRAVAVSSDVSDQPMSDAETLQGAGNRARHAKTALPEADYWAGVEGGCEIQAGDLVAFAWVQILSADRESSARTAAFRLPARVKQLVAEGMELGDADDLVFGESNSKQQNGAVGLLTGDVETRTSLYEQAVVLALIPFKNPDLF
jgi:inosine/xanthosine triphosphatase